MSRTLSVLRMDALLGQGVRFALSGIVVSAVYIALTTVLSQVSHLRFQVALVIGWSAAIMVHFTLQRVFVWRHQRQYALAFRHQVARYMAVAVAQLGVSTATTTVLPPLLGVSVEVVYLATAVVITLFNFVVFRNGIFHPEPNCLT